MKCKQNVFFLVSILLFSVAGLSAEYRIDKLANVRSKIVFPELTSTEKLILAEQAQLLLRDLYVNRYQKKNMYGDSPSFDGHVDPVDAIDALIEKIDSLSTEEFELGIQKIFIDQRDLHLNYIFPAPYSNYESFLPLTLTRVSSNGDFFQVRVNGIHKDLLPVSIGNQRQPKIGDIVVSYDNIPILEVVELLKQKGMGANKFGGFSRALEQMALIPHSLYTLPPKDTIKVGFKSAETGELFTVSFDWLCRQKIAETETTSNISNFTSSSNLFQSEFNKYIEDMNFDFESIWPNNPTLEPRLKWGLIEKYNSTFGYLKILSFAPEMGTDFAISEIVRVINTHFDDTVGLIIDLRNNGGGNTDYEAKLSQLFVPGKASVPYGRILNTDLNKIIVDSPITNIINPKINESFYNVYGTDKIYSELYPEVDVLEGNKIGQVYYKPIALITNARSYSATDYFACVMQDNGAAKIFGEDPQTGGGGATEISHEGLYYLIGAPFEPLPKGHGMTVAWDQGLRSGYYNGMLIEDHGCIADVDISLIPSDLIDGGENQLEVIAKDLLERSVNYKSYVKSELKNRNLFLRKDELAFSLTVTNTEHIDLYIDEELIYRDTLYIYGEERKIDITLPSYLELNRPYNISIVGKDGGNAPVWNMKRLVTILDEELVLDIKGITIDFSKLNATDNITIINEHTVAEDGWIKKENSLVVGYEPVYKGYVNTDAIVVVDLTKRLSTTLEFQLDGKTQENSDFVTVYVSSPLGKKIVYRESGDLSDVNKSFDISEFSGQENVAIHFNFVSDYFSNESGIRIKSISLK